MRETLNPGLLPDEEGYVPDIVHQEIRAMEVHVPEWPQAQYATADQLRVLAWVANRLGLYDAADWLRNNGVR